MEGQYRNGQHHTCLNLIEKKWISVDFAQFKGEVYSSELTRVEFEEQPRTRPYRADFCFHQLVSPSTIEDQTVQCKNSQHLFSVAAMKLCSIISISLQRDRSWPEKKAFHQGANVACNLWVHPIQVTMTQTLNIC